MQFPKELLVLITSIFLLIVSIECLSPHVKEALSTQYDSDSGKFTVVLDAGHGGFDSGKVGIDGTLEKNVNLSLAKKLEKLLKAADVKVLMTRREDVSLSDPSVSSLKRQDMINRTAIMNEAAADCIISIHQNSYPEPSVDGAQVFYYTESPEGKQLAELIQQQLITGADPTNHRKVKANSSYFLLKNVSAPTVIVECGFLSNPEESKKLVDDAYQQKLAWTIHLGILQYLNQLNSHTLR